MKSSQMKLKLKLKKPVMVGGMKYYAWEVVSGYGFYNYQAITPGTTCSKLADDFWERGFRQ